MPDIFKHFIGLNTEYPTADGSKAVQTHLDSAASPLVMKTARDAIEELLPHYSNSHSDAHNSASICGKTLEWASKTILNVCGADERYQLVSLGSGTTAVINNIARRLKAREENKPVIFVSAMEHHANDLPHRGLNSSNIIHIPLIGESTQQGEIDLEALETLFEEHEGNVNYITFSLVSNVTGIVNPVKAITALAHQYGALVLVDAAQATAHMPLDIAKSNADFVAFSGHKVYCPSSPGILIAKESVLKQYPNDELGGGIIENVTYERVEYLEQYPQREQAGTKNILGLYALAKVMQNLHSYGFDEVRTHSESLWEAAFQKLNAIPNLTIYGRSKNKRFGALAFNIKDLDHGFVAAILNDYFAIAVRNECFCAHPYVSSLLKEELWALDFEDTDGNELSEKEYETLVNRKRGMVRVSFALYNTQHDIDTLIAALETIIEHHEIYRKNYTVDDKGNYHHKTFSINLTDFISI